LYADTPPKKKETKDAAVEEGESKPLDEAEEGLEAPEDDIEQSEEEEEVEEDPALQMEEFELDGETFEVHPKLKPLLLRHAHFTKLSEQVSVRENEVNKLAEYTQGKLRLTQQFEQKFGDAIGQLRSLDLTIDNINRTTNWQELRNNDPIEFTLRVNDINGFNAQREKLSQQIEWQKNAFASELKQSDDQYRQQMTAEGNKYLSTKIKGWSPEMAKTLGAYAINFGYSKEQVSELVNPLTVMLIRKAKGQQMTAKRGAPASPTIRPGSAPAHTNASTSRRYQDARSRLKRSGSTEDALALLNL
jgi:hypothetical protein